jgi:hypothetical protein
MRQGLPSPKKLYAHLKELSAKQATRASPNFAPAQRNYMEFDFALLS